MTKSLSSTPALELVRRVRSGAVTAVEVMNAHIERIDAFEPTVRAWAHVDRADAIKD